MSELKKKLKPHAVTCIKRAIFEHLASGENVGLAYSVYCDREDCWDIDELIGDYVCAVNLKERGYGLGDALDRTLRDGTVVCCYKARLDLQLEVYANGCSATMDTAFSVLADVSARLFTAYKVEGKHFYTKSIVESSTTRETVADYSEQKTRIVQTLRAEFDYCPERPTLVFGKKQEPLSP